jgi:hypothetical protein
MKAKKISLSLISLLLIAAFACNDDGPEVGTIDDLSPYVQQFLSMRNGSYSSYAAESNSMMNNSYDGLMQNLRANGRIKDDTVKNDSTLNPEPWPDWQTCAEVTSTENEDGSTTIVTDYGDGCEEGYPGYRYFMHGKWTSTRKYFFDDGHPVASYSYKDRSSYENYGGRYVWGNDTTEWSMEGFYNYEGAAQYNQETQVFTGEFSGNGESVYNYDGVESTYKSKSHSVYTEEGSVTDVSEYEYRYGNYFYSSVATKPLIYKYSCNRRDGIDNDNYIWINVSGVEVVQYEQDGVSGSFTIDYGDGECDNIIRVTENGVTVEVDLGHWVWFCGTDVAYGG